MNVKNSPEVRGVLQIKICDDEDREVDYATHSTEETWDTYGDGVYKEWVNKIQGKWRIAKKADEGGKSTTQREFETKRGFPIRYWSCLETSRGDVWDKGWAEEMGEIFQKGWWEATSKKRCLIGKRAHTSLIRGDVEVMGTLSAALQCEDPETGPDEWGVLEDCLVGSKRRKLQHGAGAGAGAVVLECEHRHVVRWKWCSWVFSAGFLVEVMSKVSQSLNGYIRTGVGNVARCGKCGQRGSNKTSMILTGKCHEAVTISKGLPPDNI